MSYLSIYVLAIWFGNLILLKIILKSYNKLISLTVSWWFGWLFISTFSFSNIDVPDERTYNYFLLVISSISFGSIVYYLTKKNFHSIIYYNNKEKTNSKLKSISNFLYKLNYFIIIPSLLYFLFKSILIIFSSDSLANFRATTMGQIEGESSGIFSNLFFQLYYSWFIIPLLMISMFVAFSFYILKNDFKLLIISFVGLLMSSIITMGRGEIYLFLLLLIFAVFYKNDFKISNFFKSKAIIYIFIISMIILSITLGRMSSDTGLEYIFDTFIITYHTCGFAIFNDELINETSFLNNNTTYGMASTGTISYVIGLIYHLFDNTFYPVPEQIGRILNEYKNLGVNDSNQPLLFNAFGTVMYSIYLDGGLFLSLIFGYIYGYFLTKFMLISKLNIQSFRAHYLLSLIFVLVYITLNGLFGPILSGTLILYFIYIYILFKTNITRLNLFHFNNKIAVGNTGKDLNDN